MCLTPGKFNFLAHSTPHGENAISPISERIRQAGCWPILRFIPDEPAFVAAGATNTNLFLNGSASSSQLFRMQGPFGFGVQQSVPVGYDLPYVVKFANDPKAARKSLQKLLQFPFEVMTFAHGLPMITGARQRLEQLLH